MIPSLFNKVAGPQAFFIKKRVQNRCFAVNIMTFLKSTIWKNIRKRLLLKVKL